MRTVQYQLVHTRHATYVLTITLTKHRTVDLIDLRTGVRYGKRVAFFVAAKTGEPVFAQKYFDDAWQFESGYALVVKNGRYYHINDRGGAAYRWRFSDCGRMNHLGIVRVQHPRALGWSLFHVPTGTFITNPPTLSALDRRTTMGEVPHGQNQERPETELMLKGYGLITAEFFYRMPDYRHVLNVFIWQKYDLAPDYPELFRFIEFWQTNIEGPLHSVRFTHRQLIQPGQWRNVVGEFRYH